MVAVPFARAGPTLLVFAVCTLTAPAVCAAPAVTTPAAVASPKSTPAAATSTLGDGDLTLDVAAANKPWKGDLDGMIERRLIRVLVVPSRTFYKIGAETVTYVSNIFKYYVAYRLIMEQRKDKSRATSTKALSTTKQ
jgi:hypothetical protein